MAVNKVTFNTADGEKTLVDLTGDTATADVVFEGATFHGADGEVKTGKFTLSEELSTQDTLIEQIRIALISKAAGGDGLPAQEKSVEVTENGIVEVLPDDGYVLSKVGVTVDVPIPDGYIKPSGTKTITTNGTHDAKAYESVSVNVPIPDGYIVPNGTLEITENGTHDVTQYTSVNVNVASGGSAEPDPRDQYQRVEYITSAEEGTYPYIITDFFADNSSGLEVIASFPILQDRIPMGSREDSGTTRFYCVYPMSASSIYYGFNTGSSVSCSLKTDTIYRLQTNFLNSRLVNVYEENGTRKASVSLSATLTPHTIPVSIFGYNSGSSGAVSSKREYKLYSARCSRGHEVVREYIPCYRKSDGEVGLYEKITGQFLTNDGAGAFTKGADVAWD